MDEQVIGQQEWCSVAVHLLTDYTMDAAQTMYAHSGNSFPEATIGA